MDPAACVLIGTLVLLFVLAIRVLGRKMAADRAQPPAADDAPPAYSAITASLDRIARLGSAIAPPSGAFHLGADSGPPTDSGPPAADSGLPTADRGLPAADSERPTDSGPPAADSGPPAADSGLPTADRGLPAANSELPAADSGRLAGSGPPAADSEPPAADSEPPAADSELPTADSERLAVSEPPAAGAAPNPAAGIVGIVRGVDQLRAALEKVAPTGSNALALYRGLRDSDLGFRAAAAALDRIVGADTASTSGGAAFEPALYKRFAAELRGLSRGIHALGAELELE
jgi:hypothetical protein